MNKKIVYSMVSYFIISMALAVTWHLVLFHEKYQEMGAFTRSEPIMPFGMAAIILQGLVFGYFYQVFLNYSGPSTVKKGIKFSLLMGINVWTVMVFATPAKFNIEPVMMFVTYGTLFQILQFISVGAGLHFVHRKGL